MASVPLTPQKPQAGQEGPRTPGPAPQGVPAGGSAPAPSTARAGRPRTTRAGMVWGAVVVALLALVLLIVFILQNQQPARVLFLGLDGTVALGIALLIAAVGGGVLVAAAGAARIIQLRTHARRARRAGSKP
ncbi:lipopolysaccharide assembly protein LapA domain-containing protein [Sinomonas terrae]|uniref:Lipopolysaccharide assembly protein A domain-containing protein n=1 Tax=Sinomonas terrae TaxID=2908838 RepID=A0ABS9U749_9MICC|nr:lipopolysaccharide assembly protein LapA domain-containing protein [Sinomonas terrae]MCH6472425.1 hypothetical protein [Sinomonas terrae]